MGERETCSKSLRAGIEPGSLLSGLSLKGHQPFIISYDQVKKVNVNVAIVIIFNLI